MPEDATDPQSREWTGAVSSDAGDGGNWSPQGAPQPGDTLLDRLNGSAMNVSGNALAGDRLTVTASDVTLNVATDRTTTLDLSRHSDVTLNVNAYGFGNHVVANVEGRATLNANVNNFSNDKSPSSDLTVKLAPNSNLFGNFNVVMKDVYGPAARLTMSDAGDSRYHHDGTSNIIAGTAVLDTNVVGSGTFLLQSSSGYLSEPATLEFGGSVSGGQTVEVTGVALKASTGKVQIDVPQRFHGTVDLHDFSAADFVGLAQADTWSYKNDLLTIRNAGGQVIDGFHVVSAALAMCMGYRSPRPPPAMCR